MNRFLEFVFQNKPAKIFLFTLLCCSLIIVGAAFFFSTSLPQRWPFSTISTEKVDFEKFTSEEDFLSYLEKTAGAGDFFGIAPGAPLRGFEEEIGLGAPEAADKREAFAPPAGFGEAAPGRVSETTVQVRGIDEPDIVKTDGREIYFSLESPVYRLPERPATGEKRAILPPQGETKVIRAFPPARLAEEAQIEETGNLLLDDNVLVLFSESDTIYGYDVSDPEIPEEKWRVDLENNHTLVDARLYQSKVYLVTRTRIDLQRPCPIVPLSFRGKEFSVRCTDIYHPTVGVPADVTYTAFILDPRSGKIKKSVSFVGSSESSVIYMSRSALYATHGYYEDATTFFYQFFADEGRGLVSNSVIKKLKSLQEYDLSRQAKMIEFGTVLDEYFSSLDENERLRIENEFTNRLEDYFQKNQRGLEKTGIVKIGLDNFRVLATGSIPGRPLNQFSLDEYQNYLRVATTVAENSFGSGESANDVYILDSKLRTVGSITDLGLGEKIYSARFIEDKGYLVTFREIDPFFVLDLANPRRPEVKGELKIPGFSSYLHPITKDKILGIGKEGSQVKLSLFNVTSPRNPTETSKYMLDETWSDILNTHHAFLLDKDNRVFFLPGNQGGYIFAYQGDRLGLKKAVAGVRARRAIYINDYLYIVGDNELVVLNEKDWEEVNRLEF